MVLFPEYGFRSWRWKFVVVPVCESDSCEDEAGLGAAVEVAVVAAGVAAVAAANSSGVEASQSHSSSLSRSHLQVNRSLQ